MIGKPEKEEEVLGDQSEPDEARHPRTRRPLDAPTREEWNTHMVTHLPYRSWCPWCVAARGKSNPHLRADSKEFPGVPIIHVDWYFLKSKGDESTVPALEFREGETQMLGTFLLPHRQSHLEWTARRLKEFIEWMGLQTVVVR